MFELCHLQRLSLKQRLREEGRKGVSEQGSKRRREEGYKKGREAR